MIEVKSVSKVYPNGYIALKEIDLSIEQSEVFGILGENGAGKTTLIKILSTQLSQTSGHVKVAGYDLTSERSKIRPLINCVFGGDSGLYPWLNAIDNCMLFGHLYSIKKQELDISIPRLLKLVGLPEKFWKKNVGTYSKGMSQKVLLARGLLNRPKVLFLDEPSIGLDIHAVRSLHALVKQVSNEGTTVIITSHNMSDITSLCKRTAILKDGIVDIVIDVEKGFYKKSHTIVHLKKKPPVFLLDSIQKLEGEMTLKGNEISFTSSESSINKLFELIASVDIPLERVSTNSRDFSDYYLDRINR